MYVLIIDQLAWADKCRHVTLKEIQTGRFNPSTYPHCLTAPGPTAAVFRTNTKNCFKLASGTVIRLGTSLNRPETHVINFLGKIPRAYWAGKALRMLRRPGNISCISRFQIVRFPAVPFLLPCSFTFYRCVINVGVMSLSWLEPPH